MSLRDSIARHEGLRLMPYRDSLGYWTIGYGHLISRDARMTEQQAIDAVGAPWTRERAEWQLDYDLADRRQQLFHRLPGARVWPDAAKDALVEMAFQLGVDGVLRFRQMLACCDRRDWAGAWDAALDSLWARQTPERARDVANKFLTIVEGA